ncbi:MAG: helical backbone metal receptor [Fusobacterium gastrosuis]|uniref:ABC transporter substrate-binding protein n=1 Tax=Fusobacterium gastrosuis TaxID=1755100 RepID=UPI002A88D64D|nr:helical backbone metal receptor [Fusobacterium gastrosuis]
MKKIYFIFCFILLAINSFSLRLEKNNIVDKYGNKIEAKEYKRILVTEPGVIEILFEINGDENIIAIGKTSKSKIYPIEKVEQLESIGNINNMNFEKLIEYKPDLVIVNSMMLRDVERIKSMGYKVIVSTASKLDEIIDLIEILGIITAEEKNSENLKEKSLKKLDLIKNNSSKISNLKGAVVFSTSPMMTFPLDSLPGDVLKHLGVKNIAEGVKGDRPILSPEYLLKENPDFLVGAMSLDDPKQILEASNVVPKTKAGKNNNIFILDSSSILRSSYRIFDEMEKLKDKLEKIN